MNYLATGIDREPLKNYSCVVQNCLQKNDDKLTPYILQI